MTTQTSPHSTAGDVVDVVALGEVMLRLDPGDRRIRTTRRFDVCEGGGEYNVARAARVALGARASILTAFSDDDVGRLLESLVLASGVDTSLVRWMHGARTGLNFTERGFGVRGAIGVSDRANSAAARMRPDDVDWDALFGGGRVRWFHTGGVFAGLSTSTTETTRAAVAAARRHGVPVSFDTNYRPSLWAARGGRESAAATFRELAAVSDVVVGSAWDLFPGSPPMPDDAAGALRVFTDGIDLMREHLPSVRVLATTRRVVRSASHNSWGAFGWSPETGVLVHPGVDDLEIFDRVGGGDSFAAGLVVGLLRGMPLPAALDQGLAAGALAMTTPGDVCFARSNDVDALVDERPAAIEW